MRAATLIILIVSVLACSLRAVSTGDTREAVLAELGKPQSTMKAGPKEFLHYGESRVMLENGVVTEYRGSLGKSSTYNVVPAAPPAPAAATAITLQNPRRAKAEWLTDVAQAQATAAKENKLILALFTGSDWCPPCKSFEAEVAHDEQFAGIFAGSFVFFKNDWLRNTPQSPSVAAEVDRLRRKYRVTRYPTLRILNADGEVLDNVDWTEVAGGGTLKEIMIEAIDNARKATKGGKKAERDWWRF